ncbi:MAG: hypothetical protein E7488_00425 [Ruminococcaceae bacterium]|nr:hypothetical protein [Oscillospiraceae bacterium]
MFKLIGSFMIVFSSVFISSRKVIENYFTYRFLMQVEKTTELLMHEIETNLSYDKLFRKIDFDKSNFFSKSELNSFIKKDEFFAVKDFMDNLGKRSSGSEKNYIALNLSNIKYKKEMYYKSYCETRKVYTFYGGAIGLFIIILFI